MLFFAVVPARAAEKQEPVWIARQTNILLGTVYFYVGQDHLCCLIRDGELSMTANAPTWNVVLYRKGDNSGRELPYLDFSHHGLRLFNGEKSLTTGNGRHEQTVDSRLNVEVTQLIMPFKGQRIYGVDDPILFQAPHKTSLKEIRYQCTRNIPLNAQISQLLAGLYNVPDFKGIPLNQANYNADGTIEKTYETLSLKKGSMPLSFFAYPKGYNPCELQMLLVPHRQRNQMQNLLNDMVKEEKEMAKDALKQEERPAAKKDHK